MSLRRSLDVKDEGYETERIVLDKLPAFLGSYRKICEGGFVMSNLETRLQKLSSVNLRQLGNISKQQGDANEPDEK